MARDPWKSAYDRKRLGSAGKDKADKQTAPALRRKSPVVPILLVIILLLLVGGGVYLWMTRSVWLPQYRDELPEVVKDVVKEPRVYVDYRELELGAGYGLVLLGDYRDLLSATRELEPEWEVIQTGSDTMRLEAPGIKVYVQDGLIRTYNMDVTRFFAAECWDPWEKELRKAGVFPELTWTAFSGQEESPGGSSEYLWSSEEAVQLPEGWLHRAFNFEFLGGTLRRVEGRLEFGPSADADDEGTG